MFGRCSVLVLLLGFLFLRDCLAQPLLFPPQLTPVMATGENPKQITNFAFLELDNRAHLCVAAINQGVFCFDGIRLTKVYDKGSVSLIQINSGTDKKLHFASKRALHELFNGKVKTLMSESELGFDDDERIRSLYALPEDDVSLHQSYFISTTHALHLYEAGTVRKIFNYLESQSIYFVRKSRDNNFIELATKNGLVVIDLYGNKISHTFKHKHIHYLLDDLIVTAQGLFYGDEHRKIADGSFYSAYKRDNGQILVAGDSGLCVFQQGEGKLLCPENNQHSVFTVHEENGNLWSSTSTGLMHAKRSAIQTVDKHAGLLDNRVLGLAMDQQRQLAYIGSLKGINVLDMADSHLTVLPYTENLPVRALLLHERDLWIATTNQGIYQYNLDTQAMDNVFKSSLRFVAAEAFDHKIWMASQSAGLFIFDKTGKLLKRNVLPALKHIKKLSRCGEYLFLSSQSNSLAKLGPGASLLNMTKAAHPVFSCDEAYGITLSEGKNRLQTANTRLEIKASIHTSGAISGLFSHDNTTWAIQENGIAKLSDGKMSVLESGALAHLYTNIQQKYGHLLLSGSSQGLVIIDLKALSRQESYPAPTLALHTSSASGGVTIEPRINDLAAQKTYDFLWRYQGDGPFHWLRSGGLTFGNLPAKPVIEFKAVSPSGVESETTSVNLTGYFKPAAANSPAVTGLLKKQHSLLVLSGMVLTLIVIGLCRYVLARRGTSRQTQPMMPMDHPFALDNRESLAKMMDYIEEHPDCLKEASRRVRTLNKVLAKNPDLRNAKLYHIVDSVQQQDGKIDEQILRAAVKQVFNSGRVMDYIQAFYALQDQKDRSGSGAVRSKTRGKINEGLADNTRPPLEGNT